MKHGFFLPSTGVELTERPSEDFLSSLDQARHEGVVTEGVYFADQFAVVLGRQSVKIFPLETSETFAWRNCGGGFLGRFHRV